MSLTLFSHFFSLKLLRKSLIYSLLAIAIIVIALVISLFLFKDRIIQEFIKEANKSINTPVKIGRVEISAWRDFPNLAIVFHDVYVEDSHPDEYPLLTAKRVSFYLNPIEAYQGKYSIRGLQIEESETNLKVNAAGVNNFTIVKKGDSSSASTISFNLKNVRLTNTKVDYHDRQVDQHHVFNSDKLVASIAIKNDLYDIDARGDVVIEQIGIGEQLFFKDKPFQVVAKVVYDDLNKHVTINPSTLKLNDAPFEISGSYSFKEKNLIDLKADGKNTDIQTLVSFLPDEIVRKLKRYQSRGDAYFNLGVKGEISSSRSPFLTVGFGCQHTTLFHPDYKSRIEQANLEGSFATPSLTDLSHAELLLKNVTGELNGKTFAANVSLQNLVDPVANIDFKGNLDAASIQNFYPLEELANLTGTIQADFSIVGQLSLLKKKATAQQVHTRGSIGMDSLGFVLTRGNVHFNALNGVLQFNNNDLALSNVSGRIENSDFLLNGLFKNIITFLLFEDQPIGIEADLRSSHLDLDQLSEILFGKKETAEYAFSISPNLHLNFNCDVKTMKYKRFAPRDIKGDLLIKNQMAVSRNVNFTSRGGEINLSGIIDAKNPKAIDLVSTLKLKGVYIDSAFYVFENFKQDFIEDKHLKGQLFAEVELEMTMTEKFELIQESLVADINAVVKNGELNDFEPMQQLNKYLDDETLSKLRFADLKNEFHIENKTVYIPQMEIKSNATTIQLSGTHTFDQKIDYRVIAPLRNKKKVDPDESFGAIEEEANGKMKVYFKITGTTEDYEVKFDKEAVRKKIASDIKKEVKDLKDAFRLKGKKKKKEIELEKDDYFDWEENP